MEGGTRWKGAHDGRGTRWKGAHDEMGHTMEGAHDGRGHTMEGGTRWKGAHEIEISKKKQKILWLLKREGPHFQPKNFCQLL